MKKKRLISLMLAGMMTAGVATMAGCKKGERNFNENEKVSEQKAGDYRCLYRDP